MEFLADHFAWMAWTWPIGTYLLVSPAIGYGAIGGIAFWNWWYVRDLKQKSAAREAAALEAQTPKA